MKFDETKVSDKYMKKTIDDVNDEISEFTNGADDVADGAKDLYDAIKKINENPQMNPMMNPLNEGAETLYKRSKDLREAVYDVTDEYLEVEWQNLISILQKIKMLELVITETLRLQ